MTARQSIFYLASLLSAILAMKTKENAFTLPVMIALYEFFFFSGPLKRRALPLIPFILTMLIIPLTLIGVDKPIGEIIGGVGPAMGGSGEISRGDYLFTQFRVIVSYIRLLFLPVNQNIDYDYPIYHSFFEMQVLLFFLFLLGIGLLGVYLLYRSRLNVSLRIAAFGIFWFFITLSVESSVIPIPMWINEYRVYLPSTGFFMVVAVAAIFLAERLRKYGKVFSISALFLLPAVLASATYTRNGVWETSVDLWEDSIRKSPQNERAHYNLGCYYHNIQSFDKAIEHYRTALRLQPDYIEARINLGLAYLATGSIDMAIEQYRTAIEFKPDVAESHAFLGMAYRTKGLSAEAIEQYKTALRLKPNFLEVHKDLGILYLKNGSVNEARREFEAALRIAPHDPQIRDFLDRISRQD